MPAKKYWLLWRSKRKKKWNWLAWFGGEGEWGKSHWIFVRSMMKLFHNEVVPLCSKRDGGRESERCMY